MALFRFPVMYLWLPLERWWLCFLMPALGPLTQSVQLPSRTLLPGMDRCKNNDERSSNTYYTLPTTSKLLIVPEISETVGKVHQEIHSILVTILCILYVYPVSQPCRAVAASRLSNKIMLYLPAPSLVKVKGKNLSCKKDHTNT